MLLVPCVEQHFPIPYYKLWKTWKSGKSRIYYIWVWSVPDVTKKELLGGCSNVSSVQIWSCARIAFKWINITNITNIWSRKNQRQFGCLQSQDNYKPYRKDHKNMKKRTLGILNNLYNIGWLSYTQLSDSLKHSNQNIWIFWISLVMKWKWGVD